MKWAMVVADGAGDWELKELFSSTPLEVARTPTLDSICRRSICGKALTIPEGMHSGSDIAMMSILGYDPTLYYTGRAPLELAAIQDVPDEGTVFRCNLVTIKDGRMHDYSAAHIKDEDAASLIHYLNKKMGAKVQFIHGLSYRNLMIINSKLENAKTVPPHDIMGAYIRDHLPKEEELLRIMDEAAFLLSKHPLSRECSANAIWLWGQGKKPSLPKFERVWGKKGAMVAEVALVKGLGKLAGLFCPDVEGATGYYDTAYDKIGEEALKLLQEHDFVLVHVEAPDEAGHEGNIYQKIKAIEQIDRWIISPLIKECKELRLLFLFDHLTPVSVRTHVAEPVCYLLYNSRREERGVPKFCEKHVKGAPIKGEGLIKLLFS